MYLKRGECMQDELELNNLLDYNSKLLFIEIFRKFFLK